MYIKEILSKYSGDFTATLKCEHCGNESNLGTGYDDAFYHNRVIPAMYCVACGKNLSGNEKPK